MQSAKRASSIRKQCTKAGGRRTDDLRKQRPNMSDVWYSQQIAKQDIAAGRDAETIRKHMKK